MRRFFDLLAMGRASNLPTVWSNVLVTAFFLKLHFLTLEVLYLLLASTLLYLGGCFLNDWRDVVFDRKHKPDRPIPSGRFTRKSVLFLAVLNQALGFALVLVITPRPAATTALALSLLASIWLYTWFHKEKIWSLFFMAGARLFLYLLAWTSLSNLPIPAELIVVATLMASYIVGISFTAKNEAKSLATQEKPPTWPLLPFLLPSITASILIVIPRNTANETRYLAIALAIGLIVITVQSYRTMTETKEIGPFVARQLRRIPLVDFILLLAFHTLAIQNGIFSSATSVLAFFVFLPLYLVALMWQKITPAT